MLILQCISKFRVSSHSLRIHTGRFENLPHEKRLCLFCDANEIDNEVHFPTSCKFHKPDRQILYNKLQEYIPQLTSGVAANVFSRILKSTSTDVLLALGAFLSNSFRKRNAKRNNP